MTHNSTSRRRSVAVLGALGVGIVAALVGLAGPATAHNPKASAKCVDGKTTLKVELVKYNASQPNTVLVTDGDVVLDGTTKFATEYKKSWEVAGDVRHNFVVEVHAWDDPDGKKGYSFTEKLPVEPCVGPQPTTTTSKTTTVVPTTTPTEPPSSTTASSSSTVAPTTSTDVDEAALADTGASIAIPLAIGGLLLVGGVVLLFVVRRRNRA